MPATDSNQGKTADEISALRKQIWELAERNLKLKAEADQNAAVIKGLENELVHLRNVVDRAENFGVFRLVVDQDSSLGIPRAVAYASPGMNRILAIEDAWEHANWYENMHPDDFQVILEARERGIETHQLDATVRIYHPDKKQWRWVRAISKGAHEQDGSIRYINGIMLDITDFKTLENRLMGYQERLRALTGQIMTAEERERRRIAGILHDKVGQCLVAVKWGLERLREEAGQGQDEADQSLEMLQQSIDLTRSLTWELHPRELKEFGLPTALRRLARDFGERYGLEVGLQGFDAAPSLDGEMNILLYRVVSELLNNIAKHARAEQAVISLGAEKGFFSISVADDGVGFRPSAKQPTESYGFGLLSAHERLLGIGGEMKITKSPQGGVMATLRAPLAPGPQEG